MMTRRLLLDAYEDAVRKNPPRDRRFRLIHAWYPSREEVQRAGRLHLIADIQPNQITREIGDMEEKLGPERAAFGFPWRTMMQSGVLIVRPSGHVGCALYLSVSRSRSVRASRYHGRQRSKHAGRRSTLEAASRDQANDPLGDGEHRRRGARFVRGYERGAMMRLRSIVLTVAVCVPVIAPVIAPGGSPPMITDDPRTPGNGQWEVNLGWVYEHAHAGAAEHEAPLVDINYGWNDRVQLKYEVPWIVVEGEGSGLGNSEVGVKWRFIDGGEQGWNISAYPQIEFRNPGSNSVERGFAEPGTTVLLPFEFERNFEALTLGFELGRAFSSRDEDQWYGGVVLSRDLTAGLEGLLELHGDSEVGFGRSTVTLNVGAVWELGEQGSLLVSVGRDVHDELYEGKRTIAFAGWQMMF
jgi:hypothetical protein